MYEYLKQCNFYSVAQNTEMDTLGAVNIAFDSSSTTIKATNIQSMLQQIDERILYVETSSHEISVDQFSQITIPKSSIQGTLLAAWSQNYLLVRQDDYANYTFRVFGELASRELSSISQGVTIPVSVIALATRP